MKYVDEFRDGRLSRVIADNIRGAAAPGRRYKLMEFCGGHTHAIARYGLIDLLPVNVNMIHGPGCPVCVLPVGRIDNAIALAMHANVILCTYADTVRVPASHGMSLLKAKAQGADIRMVYSAADALRIAQGNRGREVVFFAIGFETTTPPTALVIREADRLALRNFTVFCNHVVTPAALCAILDSPPEDECGGEASGKRTASGVDGIVGPAHVSCVIGSRPYEAIAEKYLRPVVIAGFEPLDVMQAILMLVRQLNDGRHEVENEYARAVTREGNLASRQLMDDVFELRPSFEWRGLGELPWSAVGIRRRFERFDAESRYGMVYRRVPDNQACECSAILRGAKKPADCGVFGTACTPDSPLGSCMVSSEGACAAHYTYGRFRSAGRRATGEAAA